jgi:hypothetical protein
MAQDIYEGNLEHVALSDSAIQAIVEQLCEHPSIDKIFKPVVTPEDFKSNAFQKRQRCPSQEGAYIMTRHAQKDPMVVWPRYK